MGRHKLLAIASLAGALTAVTPVAAQFGAIFGGPPRPPADIPQAGPPPSDDRYFSSRPQQVWPREPQVVAPPPGGYPPPPGYPQQQGYPQQGYPPPQQGYPPPPGGYPQQAGRPPPGGFQ